MFKKLFTPKPRKKNYVVKFQKSDKIKDGYFMSINEGVYIAGLYRIISQYPGARVTSIDTSYETFEFKLQFDTENDFDSFIEKYLDKYGSWMKDLKWKGC